MRSLSKGKTILAALEEWTHWYTFHFQQSSGWHRKKRDSWETL